jgi:predicted lipoprotein with Yx(FWY)xxD motif/uncharacterized cupredoxin-like copper-binding protein
MHRAARTILRADGSTTFSERRPTIQCMFLGVTAAIAGLLASSLAGSAAAQTSGNSGHTTGSVVLKVAKTKLGSSLVTAKGITLYILTADARAKGKSVCYSACAKAWPPLLATGKPSAGPGVKTSLLGVAKRTDGTRQVTYKGHRLYLFVKDKRPGQTDGQGVKGFGGPFCTATLATKPCVWYAVSPTGSAITTAATAPKATTTTKLSVRAGSPSEFKFTLSKTSVRLGTATFAIVNRGTISHDFKVCSSPKGSLANACAGTASALVSPGASTTLTVHFRSKGTYEYMCTVAGHAAAGMKGTLRVT